MLEARFPYKRKAAVNPASFSLVPAEEQWALPQTNAYWANLSPGCRRSPIRFPSKNPSLSTL